MCAYDCCGDSTVAFMHRGRLLVCIQLVAAVLALEPAVHVLAIDWMDIGSAVTDLLGLCLPRGQAPADMLTMQKSAA